MNLLRRLTNLEQRAARSTVVERPAALDFDWDAYAAAWQAAEKRSPAELAAACAAELAVAPPEEIAGTGFDWPGYVRVFYQNLAGNPPEWAGLLEDARRQVAG